ALAPADAPTPPPDAAVSDAGELQGEYDFRRHGSFRTILVLGSAFWRSLTPASVTPATSTSRSVARLVKPFRWTRPASVTRLPSSTRNSSLVMPLSWARPASPTWVSPRASERSSGKACRCTNPESPTFGLPQ